MKNIKSDVSYYLEIRLSFVGVELSFSWKLEVFVTMRELDSKYRMHIKVIREKKNEATVDYLLFMDMEKNKYS